MMWPENKQTNIDNNNNNIKCQIPVYMDNSIVYYLSKFRL